MPGRALRLTQSGHGTIEPFRYRTRYFSDSGIIGTKEFVSINYTRFKDIVMSKREKVPKPVAGLDGVYSLKRLAE
jgi:putative transposase